MKIQFSDRSKVPALLTGCLLVGSIALVAWAGNPGDKASAHYYKRDTVPSVEGKSVKDFDKELRQLEEAQKQLQQLHSKDWDQFHADLQKALSKINAETMRLQMEAALNKLSIDKIGNDIEDALQKIDFSKIQKDLDEALDSLPKIDKEHIRLEMEKARRQVDEELQNKEWQKELAELKKIDMTRIQEEMENAHKELERAKEELQTNKPDLKKIMSDGRGEMDAAKAKLKAYQAMVYAMEKEGLLSTSNDYNIRFSDGEITINGKKLPPAVANRYRQYFKKESVTINKEDGKLSIDHHD